MPGRLNHLYIRSKSLKVISLLLLLHFSVLVFITNFNFKEYTTFRTLYSHANRQINHKIINNIVRPRKRILKINNTQTSSLISAPWKTFVVFNYGLKNFSEYQFPAYEEFITAYIEFRPPPALLS